MRVSLIIVTLLILSLALTGVPATRTEAQGAGNPILLVSSFSLNPSTIVPGGTAVANVTVRSENASPAYGATISFNAAAPLTIIGTGSTFYLGNMNGSTEVRFIATIGAIPTASSGEFALPYTLNYQNTTDGLKKDQLTSAGQVYISVSGTPVRPLLVVAGVSFSPNTVTPGISFGTAVNITNTGTEESFGSTLTVVPGPDLILTGTTGVVGLRGLGPGQSEVVGIKMAVSATAPTETISVKLVLNYIDKFGISFSTNSSYIVQVTATPNLKVGTFTLSPAPLKPGVNGFLGLTMINVGGDRAYDVRMVLAGPIFRGGTSTNYLGAIDSAGSASASFYFNVSNSTAPGSYTLGLDVTYADLSGRAYSVHSNYTVAVASYSPPSVTVTSTLLDPPVLMPGAQGTVTLFFKNSGTTDARNVQIRIGGGAEILSSTYFGLGTIAAGDSVTQVIGVNVNPSLKPGSYMLTINVTYADPSGTGYFSTTAMETKVYGGANLFSLLNLGIVAGVVLVCVVAFVVLRRPSSRREAASHEGT